MKKNAAEMQNEHTARRFAEILKELTDGDQRELIGYAKCLRDDRRIKPDTAPRPTA